MVVKCETSPGQEHVVRSHVPQRRCAEGFRRRVGEYQGEADGRLLREEVETQRPYIVMAVVEPCNIVMCVHSGLEPADLAVVTDNKAMHDMAGWILGIVRFSYTLMYPLTASLRFDEALSVDPAECQTSQCLARAFSSCVAATYRPSQRRSPASYDCLRSNTSCLY